MTRNPAKSRPDARFYAVPGATVRGPVLHRRVCGCMVDEAGGLHVPCPAIAEAHDAARAGVRAGQRIVTATRLPSGYETWGLTPTGLAMERIALHLDANPPAMDLDLAMEELL